MFAPVVTAAVAETSWSETVILDDKPFKANLPGGARGVVFSVLAAYGYDEGSTQGRVLRLQAVPGSGSIHKWRGFITALSGQPGLVVCDHDKSIHGAVRRDWPDSTIRLCRFHLKKLLSERLEPVLDIDRRHVDALDTAVGWTELKRWLHAQTEHPTLGSFARFHGALLDAEFAAGPLPDHWGNGAVEKVLQDVKKRVGKREFCFRNATRTNRWLELVRANLNRQDDVHAYARAIRDHLDTPGRTRMPHQLAIADRAGLPSLR